MAAWLCAQRSACGTVQWGAVQAPLLGCAARALSMLSWLDTECLAEGTLLEAASELAAAAAS